MKWLTEDSSLVCDDKGRVSVEATQYLVRIEGRRVLVRRDPEGRSIAGCTNYNPPAGIRPCTTTLEVREGYSEFIRILGAPVCLDNLLGYTNGAPPKTVNYKVADPAQTLVRGSQ